MTAEDVPRQPPSADVPRQPPSADVPRQPQSAFGSSGAFDSIGSVAAFLIGNRIGGLGLAIGLVTAWSLVAILRRHRAKLGIGKLLPITTAYLLARGILGLVTGSKAVYFGTSIGTKVLIGLVLLGSAMIGKSLLGKYAPVVIPFPDFVLQHRQYAVTMRNLTILAGIYEIGSAVWDVWLYNRTSTDGFVVIRLGVAWLSGFVSILGGIVYADMSLRRIPGFEGLLALMEELSDSMTGKGAGKSSARKPPKPPEPGIV